MNVVLDTNIYVGAAITPGGPAGQILGRWEESSFSVVVSPQLMAEIDRALTYPQVQRYLRLDTSQIAELFERLHRVAILVVPETYDSLGRDPDDDFILAAAVAGQADYIVTNDNDLLDIGEHLGIEILTAAEFLGVLRAPSPG